MCDHNVDVLDGKGQKTGNVVFTSHFIWSDYVPPKPSEKLDEKTMMLVTIKEATFLKDADTFGKQDPFIQFKFGGKELRTDVKDGAGKSAQWDETFQLPDIMDQVKANGALVFEAYDKDLASSDLLGFTGPLEFLELVEDDKVHDFDLELFEPKGEKAGHVKLSTQLVFAQPEPPLFATINYNCQLEVKMLEAHFFKDSGDDFGKQDPYLAFKCCGQEYRTKVKDDAGKDATFDDVFLVSKVENAAKAGEALIVEARDSDVAVDDVLGTANPLTYQSLCADEAAHAFAVDIFSEYKKAGWIKFETKFIFREPTPGVVP